ncbi:hypothetical protein [Thioclava sp. DLFJ4-1]|uniref:hypothetical protein n=1 Tax=Thioclava sp. DLFJ4-1 TaxID=1915313 RepID=UPI000997456F|nr:hypothetical protein [Thioclava sp. DLFJ4-1]OOY16734.1 hypothetical protein BMI85_06625 [Thioclava sp. DLFJ4-1]
MGARVWTDFEIRGVRYATTADAARALGVSTENVRLMLRRGRADKIGLGQSAKAMPIRIRGVDYPNARAAAKEFGVTPGAIWKALNDGRIDQIGLPQRYGVSRAMPITISGITFSSHAAADRALGFSPGYIAHAKKLGRHSALWKAVHAAVRLKRERDAQDAAAAAAEKKRVGEIEVDALPVDTRFEAALSFQRQLTGLSRHAILGRCRKAALVRARHMVWFRAWRAGMSVSEIAACTGRAEETVSAVLSRLEASGKAKRRAA